jgi:hypothetical protein
MRLRNSVLLAVAGLLLCASPALAARPHVEQFRFTGIDDTFSQELSDSCGFPITVSVSAHETHIFRADGSEQDLIHYQASYLVGGEVRLLEDDNFRLVSGADGSVRVSGSDFWLKAPDGTTILKNRGNLTFIPPDNLTFHGPHPSITDGVDICALLGQ